jgi:hypothetical protein
MTDLHTYDVWVEVTGQYRYQDLRAPNYEAARELARDMAQKDAGRGHLLDIAVIDCERQDAYE